MIDNNYKESLRDTDVEDDTNPEFVISVYPINWSDRKGRPLSQSFQTAKYFTSPPVQAE